MQRIRCASLGFMVFTASYSSCQVARGVLQSNHCATRADRQFSVVRSFVSIASSVPYSMFNKVPSVFQCALSGYKLRYTKPVLRVLGDSSGCNCAENEGSLERALAGDASRVRSDSDVSVSCRSSLREVLFDAA